jgi:hypothetical protein
MTGQPRREPQARKRQDPPRCTASKAKPTTDLDAEGTKVLGKIRGLL